MYSIILVEDEVPALRSLEQKILDLGGPFFVVGTAANGVDGLKLALEKKPAIVLTDIKMPDMDGIELIRRLRENGSYALTVIVSGYKEFEYARQAVQLGAQDYLLKPVSPAKLADCLKLCAASLKKKNETAFSIWDSDLVPEFCAEHDCFAAAYLVVANPLESLDNIIHPNVPYISSDEIKAHFARSFGQHCVARCYDSIFSNEKVVIVSLPKNKAQNVKLEECFSRGVASLAEALDKPVNLFYSICREEKALMEYVHKARGGVTVSLLPGESRVFNKEPLTWHPSQDLKKRAEDLAVLIRQAQQTPLQLGMKKLLAEWQKEQRPLPALKSDLVFLLRVIIQSLESGRESLGDTDYFVENIICFSDTYEDIADNMSSLITELFLPTARFSAKGAAPEDVVAHIEAFFAKNISSNITLQTLSEETGLSRVYLCRMFKKVRDTTPIDCFTKMKIEKAREMIEQNPTMPLREVSDRFGFNDMYYFSKVFKKVTGVPPSEARKPDTQF